MYLIKYNFYGKQFILSTSKLNSFCFTTPTFNTTQLHAIFLLKNLSSKPHSFLKNTQTHKNTHNQLTPHRPQMFSTKFQLTITDCQLMIILYIFFL